MKRIPAKPTKYCGIRFRSRTEAKYCELFNRFDEPWTYESQRFELASGSYLPDFYLQRLDLWIEIKGTTPTSQEMTLCFELSQKLAKPVAIAYGWPPTTIPYKPGMLWCADGIWLSNLFWAYNTDSQKLTISHPFTNCVALGDEIFRTIDEKYNRQSGSKRKK